MENNIFGISGFNSISGKNSFPSNIIKTGQPDNSSIFDKAKMPASSSALDMTNVNTKLKVANLRRDKLINDLQELNNKKQSPQPSKPELSDENLALMIPIAYLTEEIDSLTNLQNMK
ncbi:MAG: hypothetical protein A2Y25_07600 [Candidatus Melainabacteria bacterium GWF2_37_15]|nr:MAG: hypothetical protein A2Y25_07600 [Candidatus Melainabacteria bacterium GWF2_37_15]